jgi:TRAP-type mannitol/chloroaromatic compound transport system permease small subunit
MHALWHDARCMISNVSTIADTIDRANATLGRAVSWLLVAVIGIEFVLVVLRYIFGIGSIWLSESVVYGHAAVFLLAAAWTLREGGHVRVDIFYADASLRTKAAIDLLGALLLLLPFTLAVLWLAWPYAARSWMILERSPESSGIPAVFLLKSLIPLFALTLALQGVSQAIRAGCALRGGTR